MPDDPQTSGAHDTLDAVIADYLQRQEAGETVNREALLSDYPDLERLLREFFMHEDAPRQMDNLDESIAHQHSDTGSGRLGVRCPNCHAPTDVSVDVSLSNLTCRTCGSHFSLIDDTGATRDASSLTTIGHFDLIERLGVGGFGSVWKARDTELDRTVAVKIPRRGDMDAVDAEKFLREVINDEAPSPRKLNANVPRDLETICLKCMEKPPDRRYPAAAAVADELNRYLQGEPIQARPIGGIERQWRWCRRNPVVVASTAAVVVALTAGVLGVSWQWLRAERSAVAAQLSAQSAEKAEVRAERQASRLQRNLYGIQIGLADEALRDGDLDAVARHLEECPEPLRGWEWDHLRYLSRASEWVQPHKLLAGAEGEIRGAAFGPEGQRCLSTDGRTIRLWDTRNTTLETVIPRSPIYASARKVVFHPGGDRFATANGNSVRRWDAIDGRLLSSYRSDDAAQMNDDIRYSHQGHLLAAGNWSGKVSIWDEKTGNITRRIDTGLQIKFLAFSPDVWQIAVAGWNLQVGIWSTKTGKRAATLQVPAGKQYSSVCFSPDGETIAVCSRGKGIVYLCRVDSRKLLWQTRVGRGLHTIAFSKDGETLATSCALDRCVRELNADTGKVVKELSAGEETVNCVVYSPDGRRIAASSQSGAITLWDAEHGDKVIRLRGHPGPCQSIDFSPDGRTLASAGDEDGTVRLWKTGLPTTTSTLRAQALDP
jgi:WD40 repeat protein